MQMKPSRKHRASLGGKDQAEVVQDSCYLCITPHKFTGIHWDFIPVINTQQWIVANRRNHGSFCSRKKKMQRVFAALRITSKTDHLLILQQTFASQLRVLHLETDMFVHLSLQK